MGMPVIMRQRKGRLNITQVLSNGTVRKISRVKEKNRFFRLKLEWWALKEARVRGVNVPEVLDYFLDEKGREILITKHIIGENLSRSISQGNIDALGLVGTQMMKLKGGFDGFGFLNSDEMRGEYNDWHSFMHLFFKIYGGNLVRNMLISLSEFNYINNLIETLNLEIDEPFLLHRDIKSGNIIKDNEEKIWIIDWENIILGDPLLDLAQFGANYGHNALWQNLAKSYGSEVKNQKYLLYEVIILTGIIDFCQKYRIAYKRRVKSLRIKIKELGH